MCFIGWHQTSSSWGEGGNSLEIQVQKRAGSQPCILRINRAPYGMGSPASRESFLSWNPSISLPLAHPTKSLDSLPDPGKVARTKTAGHLREKGGKNTEPKQRITEEPNNRITNTCLVLILGASTTMFASTQGHSSLQAWRPRPLSPSNSHSQACLTRGWA